MGGLKWLGTLLLCTASYRIALCGITCGTGPLRQRLEPSHQMCLCLCLCLCFQLPRLQSLPIQDPPSTIQASQPAFIRRKQSLKLHLSSAYLHCSTLHTRQSPMVVQRRTVTNTLTQAKQGAHTRQATGRATLHAARCTLTLHAHAHAHARRLGSPGISNDGSEQGPRQHLTLHRPIKTHPQRA